MLFESFRFRNGVRARNRAWLAPLTNMQSAPDGTLSEDELHFLELRAQGGYTWNGQGRVRISFHGYNDEQDVERVVALTMPRMLSRDFW